MGFDVQFFRYFVSGFTIFVPEVDEKMEGFRGGYHLHEFEVSLQTGQVQRRVSCRKISLIYRRTRLNQSTNNVLVPILNGYPQRSMVLTCGFLINTFKIGINKELRHVKIFHLIVYYIVQSCLAIVVFVSHPCFLIQDLLYQLDVATLCSYHQDSLALLFAIYLRSRLDQVTYTVQVLIDVFRLLAAFDSAEKAGV